MFYIFLSVAGSRGCSNMDVWRLQKFCLVQKKTASRTLAAASAALASPSCFRVFNVANSQVLSISISAFLTSMSTWRLAYSALALVASVLAAARLAVELHDQRVEA